MFPPFLAWFRRQKSKECKDSSKSLTYYGIGDEAEAEAGADGGKGTVPVYLRWGRPLEPWEYRVKVKYAHIFISCMPKYIEFYFTETFTGYKNIATHCLVPGISS